MQLAVGASTHVIVDEEFEPILGVIQQPQALEELGKERCRLLNKHSDQHARILLFTSEETQKN